MALDVKPGIRVVRGPDWKWGNQDGGEGYVGTVVEVKTAEAPSEGLVASRVVLVQWDIGNRCNYRCGIEGKHDLLLYDNGPISVRHASVVCDSCRENGIQGIRWKCSKCFDFDLCTSCYMSCKHDLNHPFLRQDSPESPKILMPARGTNKRIQAKGLFVNASVARGSDWIWGDQDGAAGNTGKLEAVKGWEKDTFRSVAEVMWSHSNKKNVYRIGHKGKVDIKAEIPGEGLLYFPSHLPILGKPYAKEQQQQHSSTLLTNGGEKTQGNGSGEKGKSAETFVSGDLVRVSLDLELFKVMQEGHGGWNDSMIDIMSRSGTVHTVLDSGDLRVRFGNRTWTLNPSSLTKLVQFSKGDPVRVIDDMSMVYALQEGHGGWVDDMALALGQLGRVANVFPTGDTRVAVNGRVWTFNPLCLVSAPDENPPEIPIDDDVAVPEDMDVQLKLLSLLENPAVIVAAAANGDVSIMRDFLSKHPQEVNTKAAGKAAIHCASVAGNIPVINCLLEFGADLEIEDEDGDKPLHLCAYGDEDEAAKLLIQHGANVNTLNGRGATPLIIAAAKGHVSVLRVFVQCPAIELALQDMDGDTPLHHGVLGQRQTVVSALLEAGFDPELVNFRLFTPIHEAARIGFLPAMELFIKHRPTCVNLSKDDGYTPLHLAALNNHLDVLTAILDTDECVTDSLTNERQTPLHIAVHQGHGQIIERLVGFGASLNLQDKDGDSPLHVAMMRETLAAISVDTPQLQKVRKNFNIDDSDSTKSAIIACFLVQEGADLYLQNHKGNTPLLICSPDVAALVTKFVDENKEEQSAFHGSLRSGRGTGASLLGATGNNPPIASVVDKVKHPPPTTLPPNPSYQTNRSTKEVSPPSPPPTYSRLHLTSSVGVIEGRASPTPVREKGGGATSTPTSNPSQSAVVVECILCEGEVDIILKPCGHSVICRECSKRARKCPECKVKVASVEEMVQKCGMCEEEDATVTLQPCGHQFCPACCARLKRCVECRKPIETKIGLPDEPMPLPTPTKQQSGLQSQASNESTGSGRTVTCEICCERPRDTVLTCGHQYCNDCAYKMDNCPVCRKFIQHRIQTFS